MSQSYNIVVNGVDNYSATFKSLGNTLDDTAQKVKYSTQDMVTAFSGVATSVFALYNAYDNVSDMAVSVSRANLQVKSTLNSLEDAQTRYNTAVEKYGASSEQAQSAASDLSLAQERYSVAVERADMVQGNFNETIVSSALMVIPTCITMFSNLSKVVDGFTGKSLAGMISGFVDAQGGLAGLQFQLTAIVAPLAAAAAAGIALVAVEAGISMWARAQYESLGMSAEYTAMASNSMDDYTESLVNANKQLAAQTMLAQGLTADQINEILGFEAVTESVDDLSESIEDVNATIEDELLDQAQANLEAFQDCAGGKVGSLGDDFTGVWDSLVSDTNDLIEAGLLGQAQDNIQAFAECVVGKQAKMVSDIDGYLEELQGQYDENTEKINELVAAGLDEEAALYEEQNNEILAKMQQLQAWKEQLIQKGVISIEFNVDSASQNAAQNAVNNLLNKSGASAAVTITTSGTQQAKTVLTTGGFTSAQGGKGVVTPFQEGGIVTRPTLALIGEHGPEAVVPLGSREPAQIIINPTINNPVISSQVDANKLLQDIGLETVSLLRMKGVIYGARPIPP